MMLDPDTAIRMIDTAFYNGIAIGITIGVIAACLITWIFNYKGEKNEH